MNGWRRRAIAPGEAPARRAASALQASASRSSGLARDDHRSKPTLDHAEGVGDPAVLETQLEAVDLEGFQYLLSIFSRSSASPLRQ